MLNTIHHLQSKKQSLRFLRYFIKKRLFFKRIILCRDLCASRTNPLFSTVNNCLTLILKSAFSFKGSELIPLTSIAPSLLLRLLKTEINSENALTKR